MPGRVSFTAVQVPGKRMSLELGRLAAPGLGEWPAAPVTYAAYHQDRAAMEITLREVMKRDPENLSTAIRRARSVVGWQSLADILVRSVS